MRRARQRAPQHALRAGPRSGSCRRGRRGARGAVPHGPERHARQALHGAPPGLSGRPLRGARAGPLSMALLPSLHCASPAQLLRIAGTNTDIGMTTARLRTSAPARARSQAACAAPLPARGGRVASGGTAGARAAHRAVGGEEGLLARGPDHGLALPGAALDRGRLQLLQRVREHARRHARAALTAPASDRLKHACNGDTVERAHG